MKLTLRTLSVVGILLTAALTRAQCPAGFTQASLNWDNLDYFPYTGNYTAANNYLSSNAQARTQHFAFSTQRLTITHNFADASSLGENTSHTGEAGSYGVGADINFNGNGTITFSFESEVRNFQVSVYDLDNSQSLTVTAANAASVAQTVTLSKANAAAVHVLTSGTTATATSLAVGDRLTSSDLGTVNITVTGPVRTITLVFANTAGDFWISDPRACWNGTLPNNYFAVSQPFTGQPGYVLHAFDDAVYAVNPANGVTKFLFQDAAGLGNINSMAYDPYGKILYYVYSLTGSGGSTGTARRLMKYDFNTETISIVLNDLTTIGMPMVTTGPAAESGAGAFYNGSLYLGIEPGNSSRTSGREATIWRVDFDGSGVPYRCSQVFATPIDGNISGTNYLLHDWSDFVIDDGILVNFDAAENDNGSYASANRNQSDIFHVNLQTGALIVQYAKPGAAAVPTWYPGQPAIDWNGQIYSIYSNGGAPSTAQGMPQALPYISPYNGAGSIGTKTNLSSSPAFTPTYPSLGDAAEAFKPKADFGDAPSSYDPVALSPAVHEMNTNLRIGTGFDREWTSRGQSALSNSDNFDDGVPFISTYAPPSNMYLTETTVYNNTGTTARVCAWLDANGNGVFDASEGITVNVPSSASTQSIYLHWPSLPNVLPYGTYTYMRIRITTSAMTTANATGYFPDGEVEDYRIPVNSFALSTQMVTFNATKTTDKKVNVNWSTLNETPGTFYDVERSADMQHWTKVYQSPANGAGNYSFTDVNPLKGISYYRLRSVEPTGFMGNSAIKKIDFGNLLAMQIAPNPAFNTIKLTFSSDARTKGQLKITDMTGRLVYEQSVVVEQGLNTLPFNLQLSDGMYSVQFVAGGTTYNEKLIIKK